MKNTSCIVDFLVGAVGTCGTWIEKDDKKRIENSRGERSEREFVQVGKLFLWRILAEKFWVEIFF